VAPVTTTVPGTTGARPRRHPKGQA
jgi:hypothetical protein